MATRAVVDQYRSTSDDLETLAQRELAEWWAKLDKSDIDHVRDQLDVWMPRFIDIYGRSASLLAGQYYDELRALSRNAPGRYRAKLANPSTTDAVKGTIRWALGADNPDDTLARLGGATQRYISQHGRDTIALNVSRDPARVGYARVPYGRSPCAFCRMLASRGPVYESAHSAGDGHKYHDDCHCVATPIWAGDPLPEGYDPDALYADYEEARAAADSGDPKAILSAMRANLGVS